MVTNSNPSRAAEAPMAATEKSCHSVGEQATVGRVRSSVRRDDGRDPRSGAAPCRHARNGSPPPSPVCRQVLGGRREHEHQERPQAEGRHHDVHHERHAHERGQDHRGVDGRAAVAWILLELGPPDDRPLLHECPDRGGQHRADVDQVDGADPIRRGTEQLGRKGQEHDGKEPQEHRSGQDRVVRPHPLERPVLPPPEAADHREAQGECDQPRSVVVKGLTEPGGADRTGGIDEGKHEQRDGDRHDGVTEGDQAPKGVLAVDGSLSPRPSVPDRMVDEEAPGRPLVRGQHDARRWEDRSGHHRGGGGNPSDPGRMTELLVNRLQGFSSGNTPSIEYPPAAAGHLSAASPSWLLRAAGVRCGCGSVGRFGV